MKVLRNAAVTLLVVVATGAAISTPQQQGQARRALSGDLTKPLGQYTGDEFFTLVTRLNYTGGQERARRCRGNAACNQAQRTNVRVDGVADVDSVGPANLPPFGVVAMRAVVRGNDIESRYGMQPAGQNGRFSYFLVVSPGANATARWRLEELSVQGTTRSHRTVAEGTLRGCVGHPFVRGGRADFRTCEQTADAGGARVTFASYSPALQGVDPPFWIGCAMGCCLAE